MYLHRLTLTNSSVSTWQVPTTILLMKKTWLTIWVQVSWLEWSITLSRFQRRKTWTLNIVILRNQVFCIDILLLLIKWWIDYIFSGETVFEKASILTTIPSAWKTCMSYYHSYAMTQNYIVFVEQPMLVNGFKLATCTPKGLPMHDCFEWHPEEKVFNFYKVSKYLNFKTWELFYGMLQTKGGCFMKQKLGIFFMIFIKKLDLGLLLCITKTCGIRDFLCELKLTVLEFNSWD